MNWHCRLGAGLALCAAFAADAAEFDGGLRITALGGSPVAQGRHRSARATIEPSLKWRQAEVELRMHARLRQLTMQGDERTDADVRELALAWRGSESTLTVGAQQLNWGRMDILRVTDIVNPVDQHDLFYEELPEAKLALWMANWEWQRESHTLQIVVAPQVPVDRLPAQWNGLPVQVSKPAASLSNATLAVRYGFEAMDWNADLLAIRGWQTAPALRPLMDGSGLRLQGGPTRQDSIGFSADRPFGATVLRLEGLYGRVRSAVGPTGLDEGAQRRAMLGAGLDVRAGSWFFAGQVIARHDKDAASSRGAYVSLIVQRKWLQDRLAVQALHIRDTDSQSSWSSLLASYELSANHTVRLQGDWFRGATNQAFGGLEGHSRIAASLRMDW
jgi:hypothetical protein